MEGEIGREILSTYRQVSPLPREVEAQKFLDGPERRNCLREWDLHAPSPFKGSVNFSAYTSLSQESLAVPEARGSIYISRLTPSGFAVIRKSARLTAASALTVATAAASSQFLSRHLLSFVLHSNS